MPDSDHLMPPLQKIVPPDSDFGFQVADGGILQLLIPPADLRAGRFDRVCGTFESE